MDPDELRDDEQFSDAVAVDGMFVMPSVGIDILPGGCYQPGMIAHLQIVDVLNGKCYWVPVGRNGLNALIGQATHCLEMSDAAASRLAELENGNNQP